MLPISTLAHLEDSLAAGRATSRDVVEKHLAAALDPSGEGKHVFTHIYDQSARTSADQIDKQNRFGRSAESLLGLPISVKDLFDVAGESTPAGSIVLADALPAIRDATVIRRLRAA
ncbi:MAG: amidase family protein, partial [Acidobacteriaceae bacterium]